VRAHSVVNITRTAEDHPQQPELMEVDDMAAPLIIEEESGTWTGGIHPHNGYYAGDLSDVPPPTQTQLAVLTTLCRVPARLQPHH
jgi:hypothetical protein